VEAEGETATQDEIVVVEVLVEQLEPEWWARYRHKMKMDLDQENS
jgi:hypothetical protein